MKNNHFNKGFVSLFLFTFFIVGIILSCKTSPTPGRSKRDTANENTGIQRKPPSTYQDSLYFNSACVIFYQPDSLQLERIKSLTEKSIFDGSMHEYYYQQRNAKIELKNHWPNLPIKESKNVRFLLFYKTDQSLEIIDLDQYNDAYGIFIFKPDKSPVLVDMTNFEIALYPYFKADTK